MPREQQLRRRSSSLAALREAVAAMRSLAAHHFRQSRAALPGARVYREQVEQAVAEAGVGPEPSPPGPPGWLLIASDLRLCGDYNARLAEALGEQLDAHRDADAPAPLQCVGRACRGWLARRHIVPYRSYPAPASVEGLPRLLLQLAQDVLDDVSSRRMGGLSVISARFEGAGRFTPVVTPVLPLAPPQPAEPLRPSPYQSAPRLRAVAIRELLYVTLYELLLDALAAEHGMRLVAAESALKWLDETQHRVHRQLAALRRELTTQEVFEVLAGRLPQR
jgi:F-type H+-transporting ATPase subunit gamma